MTMFRGTFGAIQTLALAGSLAIGLGQTGCEKKRGLRFTQGSGDNLYEIKQFEGDTFKVKTGEKRFKGQTSRADELLTLNGFDKINNLDAVEFQIEEGLFAGIDISDFNFYGRENFEYTFKYSFTDYYVILSKVAAKSDIPSQELTFATEVGNGQYEVPLMGLPISLFTVEQVKDERGKPTRQLNTFKRDFLNQASHFKVNPGQVKYFEAPAKPDLLSADFFKPEDEWFFTKTLVGRSISSQAILGSTESALKIKFAKTNNSLIGVDLNIAKEQEVLDPTKTITALEIPVQWVDFRTDTAGQDARLKETMLGDKEGSARFWKERKYALVDFNNADRLDKAFTLDNKLEKLELSEDYVSFTIYESSTGNTYKYSLAKSNRKIEGQTLFADDAKMFHIFTQRRTVIYGALQSQDPDIDRIVYATRFYPENGEIVYHISKNSPTDPEFTDAVKASIKAWDDAFQEAGTGIRVRLSDERVELGDVRYNTIVLYGYEIDSSMEGGGTLLGFGPSVQDTRTGETFSAATHIYLRAYREGLITGIRNFIRNELGLYKDKSLAEVASFTNADQYVAGGGLMNSLKPNLTPVANLREVIQNGDMFSAEVKANAATDIFGSTLLLDAATKYKEAQSKKTDKIAALFTKDGPRCEYGQVASTANSWEKIRESCLKGNTKFADYLNRLKAEHQANKDILNVEGEEEAILECAQPLMKDLLTSTLIHEVGHNLGLGHNFAASSDKEDNHAKNADGTPAYPASSVMDYPDRDFDLYSKAGPYDVAAIRFLYARQVESTKKGEFITVPKNQSIFTAAKKQNVTPKPYRMCTDYEALEGNMPSYDPMCSRWDVGSTPEKYVKWAISQIHADLILNGYRYNNKGFTGAARSLTYFDHFRQIQQYFRFLVKDAAGVYLEKITAPTSEGTKANLEKLIEGIKDPERKAITRSYYNAVNDIFKIGHEIINLPSRSCIVVDKDSNVKEVLEFSYLRQRIYEQTSQTVQTCAKAKEFAADALKAMNKPYVDQLANLDFLDRSVEVKGLELDLNPEAAADKWKQVAFLTYGADLDPRFSSGTSLLKAAAINLLTSRTAALDLAAQGGVGSTNFLDYPWFADAVYPTAWSTILNGLNGELLDKKLLEKQTLQHYQDFVTLTPMYLQSLVGGGFVTRSAAFKYARQMLPRSTSVTVYDQGPGISELPIWAANLGGNEVLYADSGAARDFIRLWVRMGQQKAAGDVVTLTTNPQAMGQAVDFLTEVVTTGDQTLSEDEKQFTAAVTFLEAVGIFDLQPAQKGTLRTYLKTATAGAPAEAEVADVNAKTVKIVMSALAEFSTKELLDPRLFTMLKKDPNNFQALYNTLNIFLSGFSSEE